MAKELEQRTKLFALAVIRFCSRLPRSAEHQVIARQLIRAATSVGANYRAACRARSRAEFVSKLAVAEEEADEVAYWLEILQELRPGKDSEVEKLHDEAGQLVAIIVASRKTARARMSRGKQW